MVKTKLVSLLPLVVCLSPCPSAPRNTAASPRWLGLHLLARHPPPYFSLLVVPHTADTADTAAIAAMFLWRRGPPMSTSFDVMIVPPWPLSGLPISSMPRERLITRRAISLPQP